MLLDLYKEYNAYLNHFINKTLTHTFFSAIYIGIFEDDGFNISYTYVENGVENVIILCDSSMPYSGLTKYYQAFQTMLSLNKMVQDDITHNVEIKFNIMTSKEKIERRQKILNMYNPQVLAKISENYEGKLEQKEINNFYSSFINYFYDMIV